MTIYDDLQKISKTVLSEFKQGTISLVKITSGTGAADNPGAPTEKKYTLAATVSGVSYKYVRDGLAVSTDLMVVAAPLDDVTPDKNDFIEIDSVRYKIIADESIPAAGTKVTWKFLVRK